MQSLLDRANQPLGRLDGVTLLLPESEGDSPGERSRVLK